MASKISGKRKRERLPRGIPCIMPTQDLNVQDPNVPMKPLTRTQSMAKLCGKPFHSNLRSKNNTSQPASATSSTMDLPTDSYDEMATDGFEEIATDSFEEIAPNNSLPPPLEEWDAIRGALPGIVADNDAELAPGVGSPVVATDASEWQRRREQSERNWERVYWRILPFAASRLTPGREPTSQCSYCNAPATAICAACDQQTPETVSFCNVCAAAHSKHVGHGNATECYSTPGHRVVHLCNLSGWSTKLYAAGNDLSILLAESGYLAGSPVQPAIAFDFRLLKFARHLRFVANLSMEMIWRTVQELWPVKVPIDALEQFSNAFRIFLRMDHHLAHGQFTETSALEAKATRCPACSPAASDYSGPLIRIADGYFSACHRKVAGKSNFTSPLDKAFFVDVDQSVGVPAASVPRCESRFVAGQANAARDKRNDITGIFGAVCRHGSLDMCMDIELGEQYVYVNTMLKTVRNRYPNARPILFYDIACQVVASLQRRHPSLVPQMAFVPAMHSYAHSADCQENFSPRKSYGIGQIDGEHAERFWSRIAPFIGTTQIMTKENRRDHLTCKFETINREILNGLLTTMTVHFEILKPLVQKKAIESYETAMERLKDMRIASNEKDRAKMKLTSHVAALLTIERVIHSYNGTSLTSRLKKVKQGMSSNIQIEIDKFNDEYESGATKTDLTSLINCVKLDIWKLQKSDYWMAVEEMVYLHAETTNVDDFWQSKVRCLTLQTNAQDLQSGLYRLSAQQLAHASQKAADARALRRKVRMHIMQHETLRTSALAVVKYMYKDMAAPDFSLDPQ